MRSKCVFSILIAMTLSLSSLAYAQEDAAFADLAASEADAANTAKGLDEMGMPKNDTQENNVAADETAAQNEGAAVESGNAEGANQAVYEKDSRNVQADSRNLFRPGFMLPPNGAVYEKAKPGMAIAGTAVGFVGLSLSLSLGLSSIALSADVAGSYIAGAFNVGSLIILGPISNALSKKAGVWSYYKKHKSLDTAAWTLFGLSVGFYAAHVAITASLLALGWSNFTAIVATLIATNTLVAGLSIASMALFGVKGIKSIKMANYAKRYNKSVSGSANDGAARRIMVLPNIAPVVSENSKITGTTLGVTAVF